MKLTGRLIFCGVLILFLRCDSGLAQARTIRGWLSDEACGRHRDKGEHPYTGTNANCAKRCVASGKKAILISPDEKKILDIVNQDAAMGNIGNYVEITGTVDTEKQNIYIDSLTMITKGVSMCKAKPKKSGQEK